MNGSSAKILVVDDVAENRDLLLRRLQRLGIKQIDQAANGLEALCARLRSQEPRSDAPRYHDAGNGRLRGP